LLHPQQAHGGYLFKVAEKLGEEKWFYRKTANLNVVNSKIAVHLQNLLRIV
jgi:hypothetical protein